MESTTVNVSNQIAVAYERDQHKPEVKAFNYASRISRKFGFPITCSILDKTEQEQLLWAAKLLVEVAESYPLSDFPCDFKLEKGTLLYEDAKRLLANALGNSTP